jgi:hypothetical protein
MRRRLRRIRIKHEIAKERRTEKRAGPDPLENLVSPQIIIQNLRTAPLNLAQGEPHVQAAQGGDSEQCSEADKYSDARAAVRRGKVGGPAA